MFGRFDAQGNPDRPARPAATASPASGSSTSRARGSSSSTSPTRRITHDIAAWNGDYGIVGFVQHGGRYLWNVSHDNVAPGFYLGDSPHANYVIAHNVSFGNEFGIFVRHSAHGVVRDNQVWGNCIGVFFLDDGQPGGEHNLTLCHNRSWANDKACAARDDGPAMSGIGVALPRRAALDRRRQHDPQQRRRRGPSPFSGGLLLLSAKPFGGGHNPAFDRIVGNTLSGNPPVDILWDGPAPATCSPTTAAPRPAPSWICS